MANKDVVVEKLYTYQEIVDLMGISLPTLRRLVKKHDIKVMRFSTKYGTVRVPESELKRLYYVLSNNKVDV